MSGTKSKMAFAYIIILSVIIITGVFLFYSTIGSDINILSVNGDAKDTDTASSDDLPVLQDRNLNIEKVTEGLISPTSIVIIDNKTLLVTEKNGQVRLVSDGDVQKQPLLKINVDTTSERGLLGIAVSGNDTASSDPADSKKDKYVFIYATENENGIKNRIYKFRWDGISLVNKTLIMDLPGEPGPNHDGGKIIGDLSGHIYAVIGDLNRNGVLQNFENGPEPDNTSVIIKINSDGSPATTNPFINNSDSRLHYYYAYGIRNSFGLAIDPVTGYLWDTENGPDTFDELNLVMPGFNSGWEKVMGPISKSGITESQLVYFNNSHYSDPEFSWYDAVGLTDIEFINTPALGSKYLYNIFVGDINNGNLYYFKVNQNRTGIEFVNGENKSADSNGSDLIADNSDDLSNIVFGMGFGGITDIASHQDGLYILSFDGSIYRVKSR